MRLYQKLASLMKKILSGNAAFARGAFEAGVTVASAYPGTPSTEILENIAKTYPEIYAEWAPNEKVALEVVSGASLTGARTSPREMPQCAASAPAKAMTGFG